MKKNTFVISVLSFLLFFTTGCGSPHGSPSISNGDNTKCGDTVTLTWSAPTTNVDGTPLTDLAGYKIYYGTSSGNYSTTMDYPDPTLTTTTFAIPKGIMHYFVATAYDSSGDESDFSNEVQKELLPPEQCP